MMIHTFLFLALATFAGGPDEPAPVQGSGHASLFWSFPNGAALLTTPQAPGQGALICAGKVAYSGAIQPALAATPATLRASWVDIKGATHEVVTEQVAGETPAQHVTRHAEYVRLMQDEFPPRAP